MVGGSNSFLYAIFCIQNNILYSRLPKVPTSFKRNFGAYFTKHEPVLDPSPATAPFQAFKTPHGPSKPQIFHGPKKFSTATFEERGRDDGHLATLISCAPGGVQVACFWRGDACARRALPWLLPWVGGGGLCCAGPSRRCGCHHRRNRQKLHIETATAPSVRTNRRL
jgi:hypothetical protein